MLAALSGLCLAVAAGDLALALLSLLGLGLALLLWTCLAVTGCLTLVTLTRPDPHLTAQLNLITRDTSVAPRLELVVTPGVPAHLAQVLWDRAVAARVTAPPALLSLPALQPAQLFQTLGI